MSQSQLVVLTFEDTEQAGQALEAIKKIQKAGQVKIDDAAVVVKQESGKVEIKSRLDKGAKRGAVGGGILGLILAALFFPVAGLVIGAVAGAAVGRTLDMGVDKKFVKDVTETMKPGTSTLFVIGSGDPAAFLSAMRPFKGTIYQTTLSEEAVIALQDALKKKE